MAVYVPLSPRAGYTPQSPRSFFTTVNGGRVQAILDSMKNQKAILLKERPFVPIMNYESYLEAKNISERRYAHTLLPKDREKYLEELEVRMAKIRSKHEQWYATHQPPPPKPQNEPINVPNSIDHVIVNIKVLKSGNIKVNLSAPMAPIYEKYISKCVRPPLIEHLKALKRFGYPDWVLEKVVKKHERMPEERKKMEDVIETVFAKYSNTKPSKPKKKTVGDQLNSKMRNIQRANKKTQD